MSRRVPSDVCAATCETKLDETVTLGVEQQRHRARKGGGKELKADGGKRGERGTAAGGRTRGESSVVVRKPSESLLDIYRARGSVGVVLRGGHGKRLRL